MDAGTIVTVAMSAVVISLTLGYSVWAGMSTVAEAFKATTMDVIKKAADKYMESIKMDVRAVADRQQHQEAQQWAGVAALIKGLHMVPVYDNGQIIGFRKLKPKEKYPELLADWYKTMAETFSGGEMK